MTQKISGCKATSLTIQIVVLGFIFLTNRLDVYLKESTPTLRGVMKALFNFKGLLNDVRADFVIMQLLNLKKDTTNFPSGARCPLSPQFLHRQYKCILKQRNCHSETNAIATESFTGNKRKCDLTNMYILE